MSVQSSMELIPVNTNTMPINTGPLDVERQVLPFSALFWEQLLELNCQRLPSVSFSVPRPHLSRGITA